MANQLAGMPTAKPNGTHQPNEMHAGFKKAWSQVHDWHKFVPIVNLSYLFTQVFTRRQ